VTRRQDREQRAARGALQRRPRRRDGALFPVYSSEIVGFFDKSPGVIIFSREYMLSVAPSYIVLAGALVLSQTMTGAGATLTNLVIDAAVLVLLVVPASIIVTESLSLPPIGLWLTIAAGNLIAAACFTIYYLRGSFLDKQV
jgi:Na+-driven multidrug efflux pump